MSYQWGSGFQGQPYDKANLSNRMRLHNYDGPYDRHSLRLARDKLMESVQSKQDQPVWKQINTKTNIYGYRYCDKKADGYGDPSSIFSHAGIPGESNMFTDIFSDNAPPTSTGASNSCSEIHSEEVPSTSTDFLSHTDHSMNDFSVSREMNVGTEDDNVGGGKQGETGGGGEKLLHGEFDAGTPAKSAKRIKKKSSLVIDGCSSLKNFSVTRIVDDDGSESMTLNDHVDNTMNASIETCDSTIDLTNDTLDETNSVEIVEDIEEGEIVNRARSNKDPIVVDETNTVTIVIDDIEEGEIVTPPSSKKDVIDDEIQIVENESNDDDTDAEISAKEDTSSVDAVVNINLEPANVGGEAVQQKMAECGLQKMFQCDYCQIVREKKAEMMQHLKKELHHSASSVFATCEKAVVYLNQVSVLKFEHPDLKQMAVCPTLHCKQIFYNVSDCVHHNSMCHGQNRREYCVVDVINREYVQVPCYGNLMCKVCGFETIKEKALRTHYNQKHHHPYKTLPDCDAFTVCTHCTEKIFSEFCQALHHALEQSKKNHVKKQIDGKLTLMVLSLSKQKNLIELPPFIPNKQGEQEAICDKIKSLKQIKKRYGKSARKKVNQRIRGLKALSKTIVQTGN